MGKRRMVKGKGTRHGGVFVVCVVVSGGGKGGSVCALAAGSLGALSKAAVAWRG
jgi:hypothetical protein